MKVRTAVPWSKEQYGQLCLGVRNGKDSCLGERNGMDSCALK